jgi:hypothetical protein
MLKPVSGHNDPHARSSKRYGISQIILCLCLRLPELILLVLITSFTFLSAPRNEFNGPQVQVSFIFCHQGKIDIVYYEYENQAEIIERF